MNITSWTFLVSANETVDYTTVSAPDFMVDSGTSIFLAEAAGGTLTEAGEARQREIVGHPKLGNLTLVYQVVPAVEGDRTLIDNFGRPIRRIEGLVLKDRFTGLKIPKDAIDQAHNLLNEQFSQFWNQTSKFVKPFSTSVAEFEAASDDLLTLAYQEPYDAAPPPPPKQPEVEVEEASKEIEAAAKKKTDRQSYRQKPGIIKYIEGKFKPFRDRRRRDTSEQMGQEDHRDDD